MFRDSKKIELDRYILTFDFKKKKHQIEDKVIADSCEALIGSIYLDKGLQAVEKIILDLWNSHIKDSVITQIDQKQNYKNFL